jgi:hypothetical protein
VASAATTAAVVVVVARERRYVAPLFDGPRPLPAVPRPTLLTVAVTMKGGGVPRAGATIHLLAPPPPPPPEGAAVAGGDEGALRRAPATPAAAVAAVGAAIGRVTSGAYAKHLGKGCGVGLCSVGGLQRAVQDQAPGDRGSGHGGSEGGSGQGSSEGGSLFGLLQVGGLRVAVVAAPPAKAKGRAKAAARTQAAGAASSGISPAVEAHEATLIVWFDEGP